MKKNKKTKKIDNTEKKSKKKGKRGAPAGEAHPSSKLTDAALEKMRKKYASGKYTQAELAEKYGISLPYANRLLNGHVR